MIKIVCVGKIKENYLKEAIQEYLKRINKYTKIVIIEAPDYDFNDLGKVLEKEKEEIQKYLKPKEYTIALTLEGKTYTSEQLAEKLEKINIQYPTITFIIGGSYGIHEDIKKQCQTNLSFSKLTFPHQLFRVLLLEQIYRTYKIVNHEQYHK